MTTAGHRLMIKRMMITQLEQSMVRHMKVKRTKLLKLYRTCSKSKKRKLKRNFFSLRLRPLGKKLNSKSRSQQQSARPTKNLKR